MHEAVFNPTGIVDTFKLVGDDLEQENLFGINSTAVYNSMKDYNGLGLGFLRAKEVQQEIDYFINNILKSNLTLNEEVYY